MCNKALFCVIASENAFKRPISSWVNVTSHFLFGFKSFRYLFCDIIITLQIYNISSYSPNFMMFFCYFDSFEESFLLENKKLPWGIAAAWELSPSCLCKVLHPTNYSFCLHLHNAYV